MRKQHVINNFVAILCIIALIAFSINVLGIEKGTIPHTFTAGTKAVASHVTENDDSAIAPSNRIIDTLPKFARWLSFPDSTITKMNADTVDVGHVDADTAVIDTADIGRVDADTADIDTTKIGRADIDTADIDTAKIGRVDIDTADIDTTKIGRADIDTTIIDTADIGRVDIDTADIDTAKITSLGNDTTTANGAGGLTFRDDGGILGLFIKDGGSVLIGDDALTIGYTIGVGIIKPLYVGLYNVEINDDQAIAANAGGGIGFGGKYTGSTYTTWGFIRGYKENGLDPEYGGGIKIGTRDHGASTVTKFTITPEGYVGILDSTPTEALTVAGGIGCDSINAFSLKGKLTAGSNEIEGSNFDINGADIDSATARLIVADTVKATVLNIKDTVTHVLSSNAITKTATNVIVYNEGGVPLDTLETINGGSAGDVIFMSNKGATTTAVREGGNISLSNDAQCVLNDIGDGIILVNIGGDQWQEFSRSE